MEANLVSLALAAYAIYNNIKQGKQLSAQSSTLDDLKKDTQTLEDKITIVNNTPSVLDNNLQCNYILRAGRRTNWNMLSTRLDLDITNNSKTTPYTIDAVAVVPSLGVSFGDQASDHIYFRQFYNPITLQPGKTLSTYWSYNDTIRVKSKRDAIFADILNKFKAKFQWDKLGNNKEEIKDGVEATIYIRASVTYTNQSKYYIVRKNGVKGTLRWCGGLYWPGDTGVVSFDKMMYYFGDGEKDE